MRQPIEAVKPSQTSRLFRASVAIMFVTFFLLHWANGRLGLHTVRLGPFNVALDGMVAFELAGSVDSARRLLNSWSDAQRVVAAFSLGLDFLFILAYATCLTIGCLWAVEVFVRRGSWL